MKNKVLIFFCIIISIINCAFSQSDKGIIKKDRLGFEWEVNAVCIPARYERDTVRYCSSSLMGLPLKKLSDTNCTLSDFEVMLFQINNIELNKQSYQIKCDTSVSYFTLESCSSECKLTCYRYIKKYGSIEKIIDNYYNLIGLIEKTNYFEKSGTTLTEDCCGKMQGMNYSYSMSTSKILSVMIGIKFEKLPSANEVINDEIKYEELLGSLQIEFLYFNK